MDCIDLLIKQTGASELDQTEETKILLLHIVDYICHEICKSTNCEKINSEELLYKVKAFCPYYLKPYQQFCKNPSKVNIQKLVCSLLVEPYKITKESCIELCFIIEFIIIECLESACYYCEEITPSVIKKTIDNHVQLKECFNSFYWIY